MEENHGGREEQQRRRGEVGHYATRPLIVTSPVGGRWREVMHKGRLAEGREPCTFLVVSISSNLGVFVFLGPCSLSGLITELLITPRQVGGLTYVH